MSVVDRRSPSRGARLTVEKVLNGQAKQFSTVRPTGEVLDSFAEQGGTLENPINAALRIPVSSIAYYPEMTAKRNDKPLRLADSFAPIPSPSPLPVRYRVLFELSTVPGEGRREHIVSYIAI